jgi:hypothetical protein
MISNFLGSEQGIFKHGKDVHAPDKLAKLVVMEYFRMRSSLRSVKSSRIQTNLQLNIY